jgi:Spy/CpxP family protein refolding chaperone
MKKSAVGACGLAAILSATLVAQRPLGISSPADPATMVEHRVVRLTALLGLSSEQATQATTIFTNAQTALAPLETGLRQATEALSAAVKSNATATIDTLATTIGLATAQITAIRNKADAAFYAILTSDEQAKFGQTGGWGMGGLGPRAMRHGLRQ